MKSKKVFLYYVVGLFFLLVSFAIGVVSFGLIVIKTNEYLAVILSLVLVFVVSYGLDFIQKRIFKKNITKKYLTASVETIILGILLISVFWIPTKTYQSTNSTVEKYGVEPSLIKVHTGDEVAVYVHKPEEKNNQYPILFVPGGPGGYSTHSVKTYLDEYAKLGYVVYTYDPIGVMASPLPKSTTSYSINSEVEVINDLLNHYKMEKINLIASSYGGNVVSRFIEKYPERVNSYLSVDTAPLYSMQENYRGQAEDKQFMSSVDDTRVDPESKKAPSVLEYSSLRQFARIGFGMGLVSMFNLHDIPYGNHEEFDYFINNMIAEGDKTNLRHLNFVANQNITRTLENSPDFTKELKNKKTPPVLVVHPEYGVVPWQIHYQYKDYFSDVKFVVAPESGHGTWNSETGKKVLVKSGDALFKGEQIPDEYTSEKNPFPLLKN